MDFKAFFFGLSVAERDSFAVRAHTSRGLLTQVAYGHKQVELGLADVIVALSAAQVTHEGLPLTENAKRQRFIRETARPAQASGEHATASNLTQEEVDLARIAAVVAVEAVRRATRPAPRIVSDRANGGHKEGR